MEKNNQDIKNCKEFVLKNLIQIHKNNKEVEDAKFVKNKISVVYEATIISGYEVNTESAFLINMESYINSIEKDTNERYRAISPYLLSSGCSDISHGEFQQGFSFQD